MSELDVFHPHARRRRSVGATVVLVAALGWLAITFFQTQVLDNTSYSLQSDRNRMRPIPVPAPRGAILDRDGELIAGSVPSYVLSLLPATTDSLRVRLRRLRPILGLNTEQEEWLIQRHRRLPTQPMLVSADLSFSQISAIEEERSRHPGILIETRPKRDYPAGPAVAHLVGYLSEISERELALPEFEEYRQGQFIGKAGLERQYEPIIGGTPGIRYLEVDALGRVVGDFAPRPQVAPIPGAELRTSIDLGLQEWVAKIWPAGMRGALAAMEPRTGQVVALFGTPSYDPTTSSAGSRGSCGRS